MIYLHCWWSCWCRKYSNCQTYQHCPKIAFCHWIKLSGARLKYLLILCFNLQLCVILSRPLFELLLRSDFNTDNHLTRIWWSSDFNTDCNVPVAPCYDSQNVPKSSDRVPKWFDMVPKQSTSKNEMVLDATYFVLRQMILYINQPALNCVG